MVAISSANQLIAILAIISTSTAIPSGKEFVPIALLAWQPPISFPKACPNKSDAPFITFKGGREGVSLQSAKLYHIHKKRILN